MGLNRKKCGLSSNPYKWQNWAGGLNISTLTHPVYKWRSPEQFWTAGLLLLLLHTNAPFTLLPKTLITSLVQQLRSCVFPPLPGPAEWVRSTPHQLSSNSDDSAMQVLSNSRRLSRVLKSSTLLSSNHPVFTSSSTCPRHHWQLRSTFFSPSLFSGTLNFHLLRKQL